MLQELLILADGNNLERIADLATAVCAVIAVILTVLALKQTTKLVNHQIEWQKRVTEKQIYFEIVKAEWEGEMEAWRGRQQAGALPTTAPDLREKLIKAGVLKQENQSPGNSFVSR